jgi:sulfite exporter TauE/SafE
MSNTLANYSNPFMAAAAVGLSCGTACSPLVNLFLTTYTMGRFNNIRQSLQSFAYFWMGKTAIVGFLAFLSAVCGRTVIGRDGRIVNFDPRLALDGCLILTGGVLLAGIFWERKKVNACGNCAASCRCGKAPRRMPQSWPLVTMGLAYGLTPCAPLMMLLLMAAILPPVEAIWVGLIFSLANAVSPLLVLTAVAGFISQKMRREIPQLIRVFQITVFVLFIIMGSISLFTHLYLLN